MSVPDRTPIQVACDNLIAAFREQARSIEQITATLGRIRALPFEHGRDVPGISDLASQFHNVSVELRRKFKNWRRSSWSRSAT